MPSFKKIIFVLDKSGSMFNAKNETVEMVNSYIKDQKAVDGECVFSLYLFNTEMESVFENCPFSDIEPMENDNYNPSGETALFDSMIKLIDKHSEHRNIIFVVLTDGEDNKSELTISDVNARIARSESELGWKFIYLCATNVSFKREDPRYISFDPSSEGISTLSRSVSCMTDKIRSGESSEYSASTESSSNIESFKKVDPIDFSYLTPKSPKTPTKPLSLLSRKRKFDSISS
jgi:hypothetical protein